MSSPTFAALIGKFPENREAIQRLAELVESKRHEELTFEHLVLLTKPTSPEALAALLAELTRAGAVRRVIRVESAGQGGIADFATLQDVPERIHDWRTDQEIEVTPDLLRVIYMAGTRE